MNVKFEQRQTYRISILRNMRKTSPIFQSDNIHIFMTAIRYDLLRPIMIPIPDMFPELVIDVI